MDLFEKIRLLPTKPGVYLYKNAEGEIIYVGKANNLRSRVRSYLLETSQANAKTGSLMREAVDIDYILVANEHEALALENNLIKQRKPRFNILLRDDKTYPYVKLTLADRYPKVFVKISHTWSISKQPYPWPDAQEYVKRLHAAYGPERLMWATDWPIVENVSTYERALHVVRDEMKFLNAEDKNWIMNKTIERVWPFGA